MVLSLPTCDKFIAAKTIANAFPFACFCIHRRRTHALPKLRGTASRTPGTCTFALRIAIPVPARPPPERHFSRARGMRRWLCLPPRPRKMHHFKKAYRRGKTHASSPAAAALVSVAVDKGDFAALASSVGAAPSREGVLLKYTNVVKGWKRRLFTLENGVLTYCGAPDDISTSSSGSRTPAADRADDAGEEFAQAQASRTQSGTKRTRTRLRAKRRLLRRHQSRDEKERDIKGRINLQFAVITADDADPCRFAIDVGYDVYHCKAESEAECLSWVNILNESNTYFKGLIKNAAERAKERPSNGRRAHPSPQRESRSDESDESVLEDDGLREAEESRKALMGELRHVVDFWRGKWLDGSGGVAVSEYEFLSTLSGAFASGPEPGRRSRKGASVQGTAKQLLDLTAWCLQVLTTNDEMYDRRLKADLARMMGRAVPVFPQAQPSQTEYEQDRIYREGEFSEGESELEFFDALSRSASVHSQSRLQSPPSLPPMAVPDVPSPPPPAEGDTSGSVDHLQRVQTDQLEQTVDGARARLPSVPGGRTQPNIWGIVKDAVGKDLSKISIPVVLNEPISFVQRLAEDIEYSELFDKAADNPDPFDRLMYVAAGVVSHYSSTLGRVGKPFNPLLGETYELVLPSKGDGMRFVAEQVSHHPPISACYAEGSGGKWKYYNAIEIKNKFWGKSMEIFPTGLNHIEIPEYGDHYVFEQVTACVHNIVVGRIWLDNYGEMEIVDRRTRNKCVLTFNKTGWMSDSRTFASVKGVIQDASGKTRIKLGGHWNETVYRDGGRGKQDTIWTASERPPVSASNGYNWTKWAITLNEPVKEGTQDRIAPTDSRFRPDQRALENGDMDMAGDRKLLLEEGQRARRKELDEAGGKYAPRWFRKVVDEETGREYFRFTGDYFRCKSEQDWSRCDDLFSCAFPQTEDANDASGAVEDANGFAGDSNGV